MNRSQKYLKRGFDLFVSFVALVFLGPFILFFALLTTINTGMNGFFIQKRIGQYGKTFSVFKLRTMKNLKGHNTTVTTTNDPRITQLGLFLRKYKIDELPQLINVLLGQMSFVGPRPDVPGYADKLQGSDREILEIKPGITGPATLYFKNEEMLLANQEDPEKYNKEVIWPKKVELNKRYISEYSFYKDLKYIFNTFL